MNNDLAYIAGFWEGEGYVGVYNHNPEGSHKKSRKRLEVGISNTNRGVLEWIKSRAACGCMKKRKRHNLNHKVTYDWVARDGSAMKFLKAIYPYLKFRKEKVKSLIMGNPPP